MTLLNLCQVSAPSTLFENSWRCIQSMKVGSFRAMILVFTTFLSLITSIMIKMNKFMLATMKMKTMSPMGLVSISKQSNDKKSIFGQLIWDSGHCVEWAGFTRVSTIAGVQ